MKSPPTPSRPKTPPNEGPLAAISQLTDAWMRKDQAAMSQYLTGDITELGPAFTKPLIGKQDFFQRYHAYLTGPQRVESYRMFLPRLVWLTPWLVLVHFRYKMMTSCKGEVAKTSGQESMLIELKRGRWRVKFIHWHRVQAGTAVT